MLKIIFNPISAFAAAAGLFFGLKAWLGYPGDLVAALGFLVLFATGCSFLYLPWFLASPTFRRLLITKAPDSDPLVQYGVSVPWSFMNITIFGVFSLMMGADPVLVTRTVCMVLAALFAASTLPLFSHSIESELREKISSLDKAPP